MPARDTEEESESMDNSLGAPIDVEAPTDEPEDVDFGQGLLKDQVFTLIAYCHRLLCPLDHEQDFSVFWNCAEDKCVPWFESAWRQQHHGETHSRMNILKGALNQLGKSEGSGSPKKDTSHKSPHASVSSQRHCTEERIGEPGCDWKTLYEQKNAPLARKRRINDDVSQCIQSYCGGKNDLNQRMYCVIKHCHRIRSFN